MTIRFLSYLAFTFSAFFPAWAAVPSEAKEQTAAISSEAKLAVGESKFTFESWVGPALKVWAFVPDGIDLAHAPILIGMHGMERDADRYLREWRTAAQSHGFVAIFPEFNRRDFPTSREYNLGNIVSRGSSDLRPRSQWSFAAIEPLFDDVVSRLSGTQQGYTLYGHSAGSQFVHRFLLTQRNTRAKRYIAANAGWYTLPTFALNYPDGANALDLGTEDLKAALAADTVILLGEADTDTDSSNLNRSDAAMRQGKHRFARGQYFHAFGKEMARREGWNFNWSLQTVPGVGHDNGGMAKAAGAFVLFDGEGPAASK
ncbi:hypothetical protein [Altererythrobacter sp. GH1-8]|uniref:hypothetical protein n=1 Tax=Altererythrobacter sp. GH1-8 TaxID=3349333 RepID=UPI00374D4018